MDKYRIDVTEHTSKGYLRTVYYVSEEQFLTRIIGNLTGNQELERNGEISFKEEDDDYPIREILRDLNAKRICALYEIIDYDVFIKNVKHE